MERALGDGLGLGVGLNVGLAVAGEATIATPLLQIFLLPFFTQVYLLPSKDFVLPIFVHEAPDFGAGAATAVDAISTSGSRRKNGFTRIAKG